MHLNWMTPCSPFPSSGLERGHVAYDCGRYPSSDALHGLFMQVMETSKKKSGVDHLKMLTTMDYLM